jgi:HEAT repeat protein
MDIDAGRAIPFLVEHLKTEQAGQVRQAIGRVLGTADLAGILLSRFDSEDVRTRVNACFAAGWARDGAQMSDLLRRSLDDPNEEVIGTAMDAIDRHRDRTICTELLARAILGDEIVLKWMYIDAIVDVVDPGDDFQPWPAELQAACEGVSPILRKYVSERVKKRRKKLFDELKKEREKD